MDGSFWDVSGIFPVIVHFTWIIIDKSVGAHVVRVIVFPILDLVVLVWVHEVVTVLNAGFKTFAIDSGSDDVLVCLVVDGVS